MNFKWSENLVTECRNRDIVPYGKTSVFARRAIRSIFASGHVEYYSGAGWASVVFHNGSGRSIAEYHMLGPCADRAYRLMPGWNPMAKKAAVK